MKIKEMISLKTAGNVMLGCLVFLSLFHLLVIVRLLPSNIVWGGQCGDSGQSLILMEGISLVVTLIIMVIVAIRTGYLFKDGLRGFTTVCMWIIFVIFALSAVGNLQSSVITEKLIFTPLSIVLTLLALRLAME